MITSKDLMCSQCFQKSNPKAAYDTVKRNACKREVQLNSVESERVQRAKPDRSIPVHAAC